MKVDFDNNILKRNYRAIENFKKNIDILCMIRERRKIMEITLEKDEEVHKLAQSTLDFLNKQLNSKNKKVKKYTAKNIVNLILSRMVKDDVFVKHYNQQLSNKTIKQNCKNY